VQCPQFQLFQSRTNNAFPIEVRCGWTTGDSLPDVPSYPLTKAFNVGAIFKPEETDYYYLRVDEFDFVVSADLFDQMRQQKTRLWIYCCLVYLDFMQNPHEVCFCWERYQTVGTGGFKKDPTPAYNRKT
jgi:hypothetical protein